MNDMGCIYVIKNKLNNKCYVGQTIQHFNRRISGHLCDSKKRNSYIGNVLNKYGMNNFKIYKYYVPNDLLDIYEKELIMKLNTIKPNGYNINIGGNSNRIVSSETKLKISKSLKNKYSIEIHNRKGKKHSEKTKVILSEKSKGNKNANGSIRTSEFKKRISLKNKNNCYAKGSVRSEEFKLKESVNRTGKGNPMYGKKHNNNTIRKMQTSNKNNKNVCQLNNNKIIAKYISISEASRITGINRMIISYCCGGKYKTAGGYSWKYKDN